MQHDRMLQGLVPAFGDPGHGFEGPSAFSAGLMLRTLRKRRKVVVLALLAGALAGFGYCLVTPKQFVAVAEILIESRSNPVSAHDSNATGSPLEISEVESQLALMRSDKIVRAALETLPKTSLAELDTGGAPGLPHLSQAIAAFRHAIATAFRGETQPSRALDPQQERIDGVRDRLMVRRVGLGFVVEVSFAAPSPALAASIAQAVASAYVRDQVESKSKLWRDAGSWLQQRLTELGDQASRAARTAQDYKADRQMSDAGSHTVLTEQQLQDNNTARRVRSRELDRTAEAYETLYTSLLQRYTDAVNQQSFPLPTAQIISPALEPKTPSAPRTMLSIIFGSIIGLGLGVAAAFARETFDKTLQSAGQIERLGLPCIAMLPILEREPMFSQQRIAHRGGDLARPFAARRFKSEFLLHVPESYFAHGLRMVKTQIATAGLQRDTKIIGISSAASGEGKSTFAANLAHLFARPNCRTLLIDADFGNPTLSRLLTDMPRTGLTEILTGTSSLWESVRSLEASDLVFLSGGMSPHPQDADLFGSVQMRAFLQEARSSFDHIIVDLPPVSQVASTREIAPLLDGIILLAAWGQTHVDEVRTAIDAFAFEPGKVLGVVLNKTAPSGLTMRKSYYDYLAHYRSRAA